jgi:outer membrane lipoprotein-sorting protein
VSVPVVLVVSLVAGLVGALAGIRARHAHVQPFPEVMPMPTIVAAFALLLLRAPAFASPDVEAIVARMKTALEPSRASIRTVDFAVSADGESSRLTVGEARKRVNGTARILLVVLAPESLAGTAYLVQEGTGDQNIQSVYLPGVRRVRTIVAREAYTPFLNSDFTYADLGFVGTGTTYAVLGEEERQGTSVYVVQGVPKDPWYYARTVTWVDKDSGLPVARDLYDSANQLWKRERWEQVSKVDGVPTTMHVSMEDVQAKTRTDIDVRSVDYDTDVPDALFDPAGLPSARTSSVWLRPGA